MQATKPSTAGGSRRKKAIQATIATPASQMQPKAANVAGRDNEITGAMKQENRGTKQPDTARARSKMK
jgi:hypothetical protein